MVDGLDQTISGFGDMGIPAPAVAAPLAATIELGGGTLLLVGGATMIASLLVALNMIGAVAFVHAGNGVFVENGGWELAGLIFAASVMLLAVGAGRFSVDYMVESRKQQHKHIR